MVTKRKNSRVFSDRKNRTSCVDNWISPLPETRAHGIPDVDAKEIFEADYESYFGEIAGH
jgi:hypothetical protein